VAATSPITFAAGTVAFDQSANNTTNDTRYARLGAANAFTVGGHTITNAAAAVVPLRLVADVSQTADIFQAAIGAGTTRFKIGASGRTAIGSPATEFSSAFLSVSSVFPASVGLAVRGAASQTANLQEWQNSAGTVLARITNSGQILGNSFVSTSFNFAGGDENNGGYLRMQKQTTTAGAPGDNRGKLYFRDGTTTGTLKLVVRAGAGGAETTILDNIPTT
jgi:hypothetical protein